MTTVAVFRPDDDRLERALEMLESLGVEPIGDPMLAVERSGRLPGTDADVVVFTSTTGAEIVEAAGWEPESVTIAAIGPATEAALERAGYTVEIVPDTYTSSGLVAALSSSLAAGQSIEVARSDHGSPVLLEGLADAGFDVSETVLYRLERPPEAGRSVEAAAAGALDAALFTSSLTVEHFLEAATERGLEGDVRAWFDGGVVGVIGEPTADTAREHDVPVDVVASEATFETLAREVLEALE